jgi:hypothetical protein
MRKLFLSLFMMGLSLTAVYAQDDNSYRTPAKWNYCWQNQHLL